MAKKKDFVIYNTLTKKKEAFNPKVPGKVGLYVCGITAYDFSHIGHARAAVSFDVLVRYLKYLGYEVTYVRNFTDVDDKIIKRAGELDEDPFSLSRRFCEEYLVDMADLQCLTPTHQPRVTDHIEQIKDMITQIINKDFAYVVEGDVFFSVEKFPNYGQLSGQKLDNIRAGERVELDPRKRNPADFALWKAAKPGEPSWESPWGPGRPGWHIECSAMSAHYLTFKFDIHGGGLDLIFPHHENEIAQSCAACEGSNISYWMHNGHVTQKNDKDVEEKMSKSLGNTFTIRQVFVDYHPLALRYFLISTQYRSPLSYSLAFLEGASDSVFYIYQTLFDCEEALSLHQEAKLTGGKEKNDKKVGITADARKCINKLHDEFESKMSDDLNTSNLLTGAFLDALKFINSSLTMLKKKLQKQQQLSLVQSLDETAKAVKVVLEVLGLQPPCAYPEVLQQLKNKALTRAGLDESEVLHLIAERAAARQNKDFVRSDQIRIDLAAKGIALMDVGTETEWRPCPLKREERVPCPVKQEERVPCPVKQEERVPCPVKQEERVPSVAEEPDG